MARQTILFTVAPRGLRVNPATYPISVFVSPRLEGADTLGHFPDWLDWTGRLRERGLALTFACAGRTVSLRIDREALRPDLWRRMFDRETYVRSYEYKDYSSHDILSFPAREALSTIKSVYQQAGVFLGLPDRAPVSQQERGHSPRREFLKDLVSDLAVNWDERTGKRVLAGVRRTYDVLRKEPSAAAGQISVGHPAGVIDADGSLNDMHFSNPTPAQTAMVRARKQQAAEQFAAWSHMPQGAAVADNPPDFKELIDFHQALSSLSSYSELMRALGLVLDFELPADFVADAPVTAPGRLAVVDVRGGAADWSIETLTPPAIPPHATAYLNIPIGDAQNPGHIFTTASAFWDQKQPALDVFGLSLLDPARYGLAQVDLESGMNKAIMLAEAWQDGRPGPGMPEHPDVFDETTTLPSLRSGGFSLFADGRALRLFKTFLQNKTFNERLATASNGNGGGANAPADPFYAEDLIHGYRIDIWDSHTGQWHSLHQRRGSYTIGEGPQTAVFNTELEEGFTQLAAAKPAPDPENPPPDDLYLNESLARWAGWSLSVPFPGKALSRETDPAKALDEDPNHPPNEPATPFKMSTEFRIAPGSLPALRFGRRYRLRVRPVDICGNSMAFDDPLAHALSFAGALPRDPDGAPYLRFEPVVAPSVVLRDETAVTAPGSQLERLVIRTYNDDPAKDGDPADLTASDRFIVPPSTSVEMAERMGMLDGPDGRPVQSAAMYNLIGARDAGRLNHVTVNVAGQDQTFPLEPGETIDQLPYLPDVLARGAALRDLPGAPERSLATVEPGAGAPAPAPYHPLDDANPRPGSAILVSYDGGGDWQNLLPFRLALADGSGAPEWDPAGRLLTVRLPKAARRTVPLSSYLLPDDLTRMGVWQWLREYIDWYVKYRPETPIASLALDDEKIAHLLQRALEGGHWMATPPRLLTLIHAVQQPLGRPAFSALSVQRRYYGTKEILGGGYEYVDEKIKPDPNVLQTIPEDSPTARTELAPISAWRKPGSLEAFLLGGLQIHAGSTARIDLLAEWDDPLDDMPTREAGKEETGEYRQKHTAQADQISISTLFEGYLTTGAGTPNYRAQAYYDADHDLLCFARKDDELGNLHSGVSIYQDAAPRHNFNDTRYHRVKYIARATSRFQDYFPQDQDLSFSRQSDTVWVDVPASARPAAALIEYVVPTFGWQRQSQTNLKRSVRFGGGLRVYLDRPWFSSGDGEMLGVLLYDPSYNPFKIDDRERWKAFITQWGVDPIWNAPGLFAYPMANHFPNRAAFESGLSLPGGAPGKVAVAGFPVHFDYDSQRWFADITVDIGSEAYTPFIRLALARYQPNALIDAKLSPAGLADFAQITPQRSAALTADPYHPRRLRLTVSGPAPERGKLALPGNRLPAQVSVSLQRRDPNIPGELGWQDAPAGAAVIRQETNPAPALPKLVRWTGTIDFAALPEPGEYRLVVREHEYLPLHSGRTAHTPRPRLTPRRWAPRLIYAETFEIDAALISGPTSGTGTVVSE